jgi:hypothetical protein
MVFEQPVGVLGVAAATHQHRQVAVGRQPRPHLLPSQITAEHQDLLGGTGGILQTPHADGRSQHQANDETEAQQAAEQADHGSGTGAVG